MAKIIYAETTKMSGSSLAEHRDVVGEAMSKTVRTVLASQPVSVAAVQMMDHDIGSVVVVKKTAPVGIITERDLMKELVRKAGRALTQPCEALASKPLVTVSPDTVIWDAFTIMLRKKIRRLPVMQNATLVGIITERDLFKWVVKVIYEPNVPEDIRRLIAQNP